MTAPPTTPPPPGSALEWRISPGQLPYTEALAAMEARVAAIRAGEQPEAVWLVEHEATYTAGTSARPEDLLETRFPAVAAGRGGQWTYHGPGQRTGYVMLDLNRDHGTVRARDVRAFVHGLEEWMIRALDRFGVKGERREGRVGIWVVDRARGTEDKIGAIGVRVTRWVSWHGVALNVDPELSHFGGIVPCGIAEQGLGVTSLHRLGVLATMEEADSALMAAWGEVFG
ncbi:lipoyl(octanoyl) transferase LipB [Falsiroseomonas ponticola]|uniref:lipoyl(octanoyl) transferase LipB n=1 Tax=Falsiroseomonas ponticola TaxID=2786951 RepID=UPI001931887F|nr:lipoyl(octanoyl) transferase LipB [Roseomonas ponticola]